ncbi:MAG: acyl-CoA dehydratase activase-related protein [Promethearchaeota archaeon]
MIKNPSNNLLETDLSTTGDKKSYKIGIPRALYFYRYGPLWVFFLQNLKAEVVISAPTTAKIVVNGTKLALSELCVPMKIYFGHVQALIEEYPDLDYIFIPRYVSTHKKQYYCPKFLILPETIKYGMKLPFPILTLEINAKKMYDIEGAIQMGKVLGFNKEKTSQAWVLALQKYKEFKAKMNSSNYVMTLANLDSNPLHEIKKKKFREVIPEEIRGKFPVNILILGHSYNVYESHINMHLIERLATMDCNVRTIEDLNPEKFEKPVKINKIYEQYWQSEDEILKTARYYLTEGKSEIDGVIFLISFACGPDSLIQELVMRDMKTTKIPFLSLILDEHSGESGVITRIESLVDMIRRKKYS